MSQGSIELIRCRLSFNTDCILYKGVSKDQNGTHWFRCSSLCSIEKIIFIAEFSSFFILYCPFYYFVFFFHLYAFKILVAKVFHNTASNSLQTISCRQKAGKWEWSSLVALFFSICLRVISESVFITSYVHIFICALLLSSKKR